MRLVPLAVLLAASCLALAQFVSHARNLTVVRSPADASVTVSYKEPEGACRTAFDSQKQYTGWVSVPGDAPTNLFFWFVQAREPTDGLTIWLNGGPGFSSMLAFFAGNGPCEIVEKSLERYDTVVRKWGWDRASNMLFVDQPNQVGFSYDTPTNGTVSMINGLVLEPPAPASPSSAPWDLLNGTFSTNDPRGTANTTQSAAMAVWHLLQGFLTTFPQYQPRANASVGLGLFTESYGGVYGPVFAETWQAQNRKRLTGALSRNTTLELRLASLGIVNGCVDRLVQVPLFPTFATGSTYGFKAMSAGEANYYLGKFSGAGECKDLVTQCQAASAEKDPDGHGNQADVNDLCTRAAQACLAIEDAYYNCGRSGYDLAAHAANPQPALFFADYLNQASVQEAVGSPVNFTMMSANVAQNFGSTGDIARGGNVGRLAALVQGGVRLGLMYGDRDYLCNWFGGEALSLAVAQQAGGDYATKFPAAGYAPIIVNDSYIGGDVRQYGNLSFSRIYQAGHSVAWYQPETAFQVFARIIMGRSLSTGSRVDLAAYNTTGPVNSTRTAKLPDAPDPTCFVRAYNFTCDENAQKLASRGGSDGGVVINGVLYDKSRDWPLASGQPPLASGQPPPAKATKPSSAEAMTGVYTATKTPDSAASLTRSGLPAWALGVAVLALHEAMGLA